MPKTEEKQKKQDLGIFYTPPAVSSFIFDILLIWKSKEEKETGRWESRKHYPSVIDPAVGEGVFLKSAIEKGFTTPKYIFGIDIDEDAKKRWEEINLLRSFGSKAELDVHFFHQNGLLPLDEKKVLRYKRGGLKEFDAVVGNPPYGGLGVDLKNKKNPEAIALLNTLVKYEIFWWKRAKQNNRPNKSETSLSLFGNFASTEAKNRSLGITEVAKIAEGIPIEILFTERFLQLAKHGGWVAIIIPDGILTNSNAHYVREFIANKAKVEAIVSLPRGTFKQAGTSAKTSILFLRKYKQDEQPHYNYPIFLSSVTAADEENLKKVVTEYTKFYNHNNSMNNSNHNNKIAIIKDESGKEAVMVRVDKTLKEMMEEQPSSRWDTEYWHPKFDDFLSDAIFDFEILGKYILQGTEGITYGSTKPREWSVANVGVKYIKSVNVLNTGLDIVNIFWTPEGGRLDGSQYRVKVGDLIMNKSGTGTFGRLFVIDKDFGKMVVSQHTMRIRLSGISPFFVAVYMQTEYGYKQIQRLTAGVSGQVHIDFDDIKSIKIPDLPEKIQKNIESEYKKMSAFHDRALEAKKKGDEAGYKKNIETAERMLRDLIARTEAVIRGEREDVV